MHACKVNLKITISYSNQELENVKMTKMFSWARSRFCARTLNFLSLRTRVLRLVNTMSLAKAGGLPEGFEGTQQRVLAERVGGCVLDDTLDKVVAVVGVGEATAHSALERLITPVPAAGIGALVGVLVKVLAGGALQLGAQQGTGSLHAVHVLAAVVRADDVAGLVALRVVLRVHARLVRLVEGEPGAAVVGFRVAAWLRAAHEARGRVERVSVVGLAGGAAAVGGGVPGDGGAHPRGEHSVHLAHVAGSAGLLHVGLALVAGDEVLAVAAAETVPRRAQVVVLTCAAVLCASLTRRDRAPRHLLRINTVLLLRRVRLVAATALPC